MSRKRFKRFSRKAFLYTSVALMLIAALVLMASTSELFFERTTTEARRVHLIDRYMSNLQDDLPRAAYIAGFRSLIGIEEHISTTGVYVSDFDATFTSIFVNGSVNGTFYGIMQDSTFTAFADRFRNLSATQGIDAQLTVLGVEAFQTTPWMVDLNVTVRTILRDRAGTVTFDRIDVVQTSIPIEDIKDPLYSVGTQGRAPQPVQRSTVVPPYITATNVTTGLQQLVNGTLYIASTHAPSFLQRFEGNLSSSPYGIQSLVDVQELRAQDLTIETCKSVVDYVYFGPTSSAPNYYIINMDQANFWLDDANIAIYNASGKVVGTRPCP